MSRFSVFIFILLSLNSGLAQEHVQVFRADTATQLVVGRILIIGNKVTKDRIIFRELSVQTGDTISRIELNKALQLSEIRLYNLRIFNKVQLSLLELSPGQADILIDVAERWYTFPVPIFELSDRNFNEWWQNYRHDFSRVNYGLRLFQYNFRGRNETLRLTARFGFSKRFDLYYKIPNLSRDQKHGLTFEYDFLEPANLPYKTEDHVLTFLNERRPLKREHTAIVTYNYRKNFYQTHAVELGWDDIQLSDTIFHLNPNYLAQQQKHQWYSFFSYRFVSEHRDVVAYPLRGYQITAGITKTGLGFGDQVNQVNLSASYALHREVYSNWFFSVFSSANYSSLKNPPYNQYRGIGYRRQFLRGYEVYVIEGPFYNMNKATFKRRIFSTEFNSGIPLEQFRSVPLSVYLKGYADLGYVQNYPGYEHLNLNTRLSGLWLGGAGFGIDVVTHYDSVIRLEYTFTTQQTNGFFLHIRKEF